MLGIIAILCLAHTATALHLPSWLARHEGRLHGAKAENALRRRADQSYIASVPGPICTGPSCYIGCFHDSWTRTVGNQSISSNSMTVDSCQEICLRGAYSYAGLEGGRQVRSERYAC
ncbi:hypothetical protein BD324DRAFT_629841 [Kockovaella imperatae]|uniref:WSC domain-containing protein n=1 Tax=Kockovaella imperatae TaxID=4999 RepID=A0A1Y1UEQ0_9TREE|nr:hypothetical protein BD324DRAFT_629841 [Kockovaella imperatae]ORX36007.1 hypothetical protein BD324DRAFT_629841 [Kockovaella imperatae]